MADTSIPLGQWNPDIKILCRDNGDGTYSLTVGGLGGIDDTKEEDPDQNATVIALLKGMLSLQVQILNKLNASINVNIL